jgi:hypothetical protein
LNRIRLSERDVVDPDILNEVLLQNRSRETRRLEIELVTQIELTRLKR